MGLAGVRFGVSLPGPSMDIILPLVPQT
jgi:hypothetical protein